jgi:hypothetical protein
MANGLYYAFRNGQLGLGSYTAIDFEADTALKLVLTDHGAATPDITVDDFYNDISAGTVGSLSGALGSRTVGTVAVGVFDAADLSPAFTAVSGATVESISLLKDSGVGSTSPLIGYWDTATGLPLTPNGGDVNVTMNASGIFKF